MKLLRVAGIDLELHWTFLLLLVFILLGAGADGAITLLVLFTSVVLHEFSHSLVGKRYGVRVRRIILLPIGGMAVVDDLAMSPSVELRVALAGPIFSFLLALLSFAVLIFAQSSTLLQPITFIVSMAFEANIAICLFNLLPAIPLDGGRVWRALKQRKSDYLTATRDAVTLSKRLAAFLLFGSLLAAFIFNSWGFLFWNGVISLFILLSADMELGGAVFKTAAEGLFVRDVLDSKLTSTSPQKSLHDAFKLALSARASTLVLAGTSSLASTHAGTSHPSVVSVASFARIPHSEWKKVKLHSLHPVAIHFSPETTALEAWKKMRNAGVELAPVLSKEKLVGVVREADLERLILLKKIALGY